MTKKLEEISRRWFLQEPAYFSLYCLQKLQENERMKCPVRCGQGMIEYNPVMLQDVPTEDLEKLLRVELIRIFLKHPYERKPDGVSNVALLLGSDAVIADQYNKNNTNTFDNLLPPSFFGLDGEQNYEFYSRRIQEMLPHDNSDNQGQGDGDGEGQGQGSGQGSSNGSQSQQDQQQGNGQGSGSNSQQKPKESDLNKAQQAAQGKADLWEEDEMKQQEINDLISGMKSWGSIPNHMVENIIASTKARIDYRKIVQGFRGSILSNERKLTRMRPNRRSGFQQMGSTRRFNTKLLVAVDVSGSINDVTLSNFYGVINKMFKYGIQEIDCVQFDCVLGEVRNIRKANRNIEVCGRGGTSFQPIFDYLKEHIYDGVVILTDGYAEHPNIDEQVKRTTNVLWVCEDEKSYEQHKNWMALSGRVCFMQL